MKAEVTLKQLLEAGVHFGHQTNRWNPKMEPYIFGARNGIYIIDLEKTLKCLERACEFLGTVAEEGREILFVGTKRQAKEIVQEIAEKCGMSYVTERWLGGTLTNFETVRKSVGRMESIEKMAEEGMLKYFTKKEAANLNKELEKLKKNLSGIRKLKRLPGALFVIDPKNEEIAVREAGRLGIPVVALIDTNSDPDLVTYPLPGNDDAIRSIKLISTTVGEIIMQARQTYLKTRAEEEEPEVEKPGDLPVEQAEEKEKEIEKEIAPDIVEELEDKFAPKKPSKSVGDKFVKKEGVKE